MQTRRTAALLAAFLSLLLTGCRATFWSPDSKQIAVTAYGGIHLFDVGTGAFRKLVPGEAGEREALAPVWSADGKRLCFARAAADGMVSVETLEVTPGKRRVLLPRSEVTWEDRHSSYLAWCPDDRRVAFGGTERPAGGGELSTIWIITGSRDAPRRLAPRGRSVAGPSWSPDGRRIAYLAYATPESSGPTMLQVADPDGKDHRRLWTTREGTEIQSLPHWSPDGKRLGVLVGKSDGDTTSCEAWIISAAGGSASKLADVPGEGAYASFLPDLRSVFFVSSPDSGAPEEIGGVAILSAPFRRPRLLARGAPADLSAPTLSPDGKTVAVIRTPDDGPVTLLLRFADGAPGRDYAVPR